MSMMLLFERVYRQANANFHQINEIESAMKGEENGERIKRKGAQTGKRRQE